MTISPFATRVIAWQRRAGRHDLPWQNTRDPYRIWLSEIMLQQTQVAAVIPYYARFLATFPTLASLAAAPVDAVMQQWAGLGYYARGRNLHAAAKRVMTEFGGVFPHDPVLIQTLPGIGRSTANAIAAFAFGVNAPILDGNVKRVLARYCGVDGYPSAPKVEALLWEHAHALQPVGVHAAGVVAYTQGMMDLGARICTRSAPACAQCPVNSDCAAWRDGRTEELPAPKPSKPLPVRHVSVLVITDGDCFLTETRPPSGIWGGLRSLPETTRSPEEWLRERLRVPTAQLSICALDAFRHTFTHFHLTIEPILVRLPRGSSIMKICRGSPPLSWLTRAEIATAGLPAPIKRLLSERVAQGGPTTT